MPRAKKVEKQYSEYELATHKGRQISESKDPSYCGSIGIEGHVQQINDKSSWVQMFLPEWAGLGGCTDPTVPVEQKALTLRYSPSDMEKLDQFAIGLLRDGTGSIRADDVAFVNRVRDAYLRAEVMLTIRKEIAALEA